MRLDLLVPPRKSCVGILKGTEIYPSGNELRVVIRVREKRKQILIRNNLFTIVYRG